LTLARVIKASSKRAAGEAMAFNLDDLTVQATRYLTEIRQQGDAILHEASKQAELVREEARQAGTAEGLKQADEEIEQRARQIAEGRVLPSLEKTVKQLAEGRAAWLRSWENGAIRLSIAIAERIVRRTIDAEDSVTRALVTEALELVAGATEVTLRMNPDDLQALGTVVDACLEDLRQIAPIQTVADEQLAKGDCVVQTRDGTIDGRLETRLKRIEDELLG